MQPTDTVRITRTEWQTVLTEIKELSKNSQDKTIDSLVLEKLKRLSKINKNGIPLYQLPQWSKGATTADQFITNMKRDIEVVPDDKSFGSSFKAFASNAWNFATSRTNTEWKVVLLFCSLMILGIWSIKKLYNKWKGKRRMQAETVVVFDAGRFTESAGQMTLIDKAGAAVPEVLVEFSNEPRNGLLGKLWTMLCVSILGYSEGMSKLEPTELQKNIKNRVDTIKQLDS